MCCLQFWYRRQDLSPTETYEVRHFLNVGRGFKSWAATESKTTAMWRCTVGEIHAHTGFGLLFTDFNTYQSLLSKSDFTFCFKETLNTFFLPQYWFWALQSSLTKYLNRVKVWHTSLFLASPFLYGSASLHRIWLF